MKPIRTQALARAIAELHEAEASLPRLPRAAGAAGGASTPPAASERGASAGRGG